MFEIPCRTCLSQRSLKQVDETIMGEQNQSVYDFLICWPPTKNIRRDHKICSACIEKVNGFYKFQLQVNLANRAFSEFYESAERALPNDASIKLEIDETNDSTEISYDTTLMTTVQVAKNKNFLDELNHTLDGIKNETDLEPVVDFEDSCGKTTQNPPTIVQIEPTDIVEIPNSGSKSNGQRVDSQFNAHGQCNVCKKEMPLSLLSRHKVAQTKQQPLEKSGEEHCCDACKINFRELDDKRKRRKRKKRAQTFSKFKSHCCDVCGRKFTHTGHLTAHHRIHSGEKPYGCDVCGRKFSVSSNLTVHKRTHNGEKPYGFDVCGRKFSGSANLTVHKRTHNGEKPYSCDVCGRKFGKSSTLTVHKRTHNVEKPYSCDVCGKKFGKSSSLTAHHRIHSGEKPYGCDVCGRRFARSSSLTTHKRSGRC